jgi:hypothetical protein
VAEIPPEAGIQWLLVSDDADQIVDSCFDTVTALSSRSDVHFLLTARRTDWINANAGRKEWRKYADLRPLQTRGLTYHDAVLLTQAWSRQGPEGLRELAAVQTETERADVLWKATQREAVHSEGALLGGMLRVRYKENLEAHVVELMRRLDDRPLLGDKTLLYAFVHIAAPHAINLLTLTPGVLGEILEIDAEAVDREVVVPLGQEAAASIDGGFLLVRHRAIAEAAMKIIERSFGWPWPEIYARLVRGGIRAVRHTYVPDLKQYRYMSQSFMKDRKDVAVAAARAAFQEEPDDLRRFVNLALVLNDAGASTECVQQAGKIILRLPTMLHRIEALRRFYHVWSVAEGAEGHYGLNCWLAAASVADLSGISAPSGEDIEVAFASIGFGILELLKNADNDALRLGLRAVDTLSRGLQTRPETRQHLNRYRSAANRMKVPEIDRSELEYKFRQAIITAWGMRERPLPDHVPAADNLNYRALFRVLDP